MREKSFWHKASTPTMVAEPDGTGTGLECRMCDDYGCLQQLDRVESPRMKFEMIISLL